MGYVQKRVVTLLGNTKTISKKRGPTQRHQKPAHHERLFGTHKGPEPEQTAELMPKTTRIGPGLNCRKNPFSRTEHLKVGQAHQKAPCFRAKGPLS